MRASYDTLFGKVKNQLAQDPLSGHLFVFVSSRRTACKCLYYDGTGLVIISKRLEENKFSQVNPLYQKELSLSAAEFSLFFEGANLEKRFIDAPGEAKRFLKNKKNNSCSNNDCNETSIV